MMCTEKTPNLLKNRVFFRSGYLLIKELRMIVDSGYFDFFLFVSWYLCYTLNKQKILAYQILSFFSIKT